MNININERNYTQLRITKPLTYCLGMCIFLLVPAHRAQAKPEFAKKEKKSCLTCHVSVKSKELNETGKHYSEHKKLPAK